MKKESFDVQFQLYRLTNTNSVLGYPYIGVSSVMERVINISDDHISIDTIHKNDQHCFNEDYIATLKSFNFDFHFLDQLVEEYIGQRNYSLIAYFDKKKKVVLAYRSVLDDSYLEKDLAIDFPDYSASKEIVSVIHNLLRSIKI